MASSPLAAGGARPAAEFLKPDFLTAALPCCTSQPDLPQPQQLAFLQPPRSLCAVFLTLIPSTDA